MDNFTKSVRMTVVNGKSVQLSLLKARDGFQMAMRLQKLILPAIGALVDGNSGIDTNAYARAASLLVSNMESDEILMMVEKLLGRMTIDGQVVNFDEYFMANYGELVDILQFALKENFESFFASSGFNSLRSILQK